jgi:hypothetical protein
VPARYYAAIAVVLLVAIPVGAQAVIVGSGDEGTIDLVMQRNQSAALTLTYDVPQVVAHVRAEQLADGDTEQRADQLQVYAERFPVFMTWVKSDIILKKSILHTVKLGTDLDRIAVTVNFTDSTSRTRLFEEFYCTEDCLTGKLPRQRNLTRWAVQQVQAEVDGSNSQSRTPADFPWAQRAWSRWASLR